MRPKYKVLEYNHSDDYHICVGEDGKRCNIDLMTNGDLHGVKAEELVGRTVSVAYLHPWVSFGMEVQLEPMEAKS
jgi:hypothetical protein